MNLPGLILDAAKRYRERMETGARGPGLDCVAETLGISGTSAGDAWKSLGPGNSWSAPVTFAGRPVAVPSRVPRTSP